MKRTYWINVTNVDNRLVIYLNGETLWDSGIVHDDPEMNHFIDITLPLKEHPNQSNELIFEGFNDDYHASIKDDNVELKSWHFGYRVFRKVEDAEGNVISEEDMLKPYNEKHMSNPNIRAINNSYIIVASKEGEGFKVISNSLSQHFYN